MQAPAMAWVMMLVLLCGCVIKKPMQGSVDQTGSVAVDFDQHKPVSAAAGVASDPLSSVVAIYTSDQKSSIPDLVSARVQTCLQDPVCSWGIGAASRDRMTVMPGMGGNIVVSWLDPINGKDRFGANNDYLAYFGDRWQSRGVPQWNGSPNAGFLWVNHEYISADSRKPLQLGRVPDGQFATLVRHLQASGRLSRGDWRQSGYWNQNHLDVLVAAAQEQLGASWLRVIRKNGAWRLRKDRQNIRYNATADTLFTMTGPYAVSVSLGMGRKGKLPQSIVPGTLANCSGGTSPWGTVLSAEENNVYVYGDAQPLFARAGVIYDVASAAPGAWIRIQTAPRSEGMFSSASSAKHVRLDHYGWAAEIDPGLPAAAAYKPHSGAGHAKLSALGQGRWENFSFAVNNHWHLLAGQPIVIYYGNDRPGGRVYKFVSENPYVNGMDKTRLRALLNSGTVYVSQLPGVSVNDGFRMQKPGHTDHGKAPTREGHHTGRWIAMSLTNHTDVAPNAGTAGGFHAVDPHSHSAQKAVAFSNAPDTKVGQALRDRRYNGIGGFRDQSTVLAALFTAANKIGVFAQNRPEDVEWNPMDKNIYIAYTNHRYAYWLDQSGKLHDNTRARTDKVGRLWAFREADIDHPGQSMQFQFWQVAAGDKDFCRTGNGFANPDNIVIDKSGGVWFTTDGQFKTSGKACGEGFYYLSMNTHGHGKAFRMVTAPSDAELTGPAFNSDMSTLFLSVQHPGERQPSRWPPR